MNPIARAQTVRCRSAAFTLVELLVVIAIILIASSVIFIGGGGGDGQKLSSSLRIVSGIAQGARGQAVMKNQETRLIIHNDVGQDPDKYRRFFGIVYENPEQEGEWIAATQGTYLPRGIYFDPEVSEANGSGPETMTIEYPRNTGVTEGTGEQFYYYAFNDNGTIGQDFANEWLVVRAGTLRPIGEDNFEIEITDAQERLIGALIFRRAGTTTRVDNPGEILD